MNNINLHSPLQRYLSQILKYRWMVVFLSLILLASVISPLKGLYKDTSLDAFIHQDHPALQYRDQVEEVFGLEDPLVIGIIDESELGILDLDGQRLIWQLTESLKTVPGIDPEKVHSVSTEYNVYSAEGQVQVEHYLPGPPASKEQAQEWKQKMLASPLVTGTLVSESGKAALIVAELLKDTPTQEVYASVQDLVAYLPKENKQIHIAGEGVIRGYLSIYINDDARVMVPLSLLVISIILTVAFRSIGTVLIAYAVILFSAATAIGTMTAANIPYFVITSTLPVILIGISVADVIHVMGEYFHFLRNNPQRSIEQAIRVAIQNVARPIWLTTLTTMAGFIGIYLSTDTPPVKFFGLFAAVGIFMAWLITMTLVPALLSLLKPTPKNTQEESVDHNSSQDLFSHIVTQVGTFSLNRSVPTLLLFLCISLAALFLASDLEVNERRIASFHVDTPIYQADEMMNREFWGTNYLDVVIETESEEGLLETEVIEKIIQLQAFALTLDHINGSRSFLDYVKAMHSAINDNDPSNFPTDPDAIAQYLLLLTANSSSNSWAHLIDNHYQTAHVRLYSDTSLFTTEKKQVEALRAYLDESFESSSARANISGAIYLNYHFLNPLGESHARSVVMALIMVLLLATLSFRSLIAGLYALIPVVSSILFVYAAMGWFGIYLSISTSMFAAIAIGLGVDFAIHTIDRIIELVKRDQLSIEEATPKLLTVTGRSLFFNCIALAIGFGVMVSSQVPTIINFGVLTASGVFAAFLVSTTILPALIKLTRPDFVFKSEVKKNPIINEGIAS